MISTKHLYSFAAIILTASVIVGAGALPAAAEIDSNSCQQLLGFYSDKNLRPSSENRYLRVNKGEAIPRAAGSQVGVYIDFDYKPDNPEPDPADVTVSGSGWPSGVSLKSEINQAIEGGKPYKGKYYYIIGTPKTEGEWEVELEASAPGCPDDTGRVFIQVGLDGEGVSCSLSNPGAIQRGQKATLTWRITGPARRGSMDPAISGSGSTRFAQSGSGQTNTLNEDTIFTLNVEGPINDAECSTEVLVGGTSGVTTQYIKTILDMPTISPVGGGQMIADTAYVNGRFVFSGSYSVGMDGRSLTGGTWTVKEDGSGLVQERSAALDAGADSTRIYQHGNAHAVAIHEIGANMYVRENASWASCPQPGTDVFSGNCVQYGKGAHRAVIYDVTPGEGADIVTLSPTDEGGTLSPYAAGIMVNDKYAIGAATKSGLKIVRLPGWNEVGTVPANTSISFGYNDYFIGANVNGSTVSKPHVYKVENNNLRDLGELPNGPQFIGFHTLDHSVTPARLVMYQAVTRTNDDRKLLVYAPKADGTGLQFVKEMAAPRNDDTNIRTDNPTTLHGFGVWGDYVVWPESGGWQGDGDFSVWKNGEKIDTVRKPNGGGVASMVIGKNGYLMITGTHESGGGIRTAAYLYKLGVPGAGGPVVPGPGGPGGPGVVVATSSSPYAFNSVENALDFTQGYLSLLQALFGSQLGGGGDTAAKSAFASSSGAFQSAFQQAIGLINSYSQ